MSETRGRWTLKAAAMAVGTMAALFAAGSADASVLMLDFGPTTPVAPHDRNSPYHAADATFTGAKWNILQTADVASGLLYADNTAAEGVAVNLGSSIDSTLIDLNVNPDKSSALGSATSTGIYNASTPGRDGIWKDGKGSSTGVQITGLEPGVYEVYVTARNTNSGQKATTQTIFAGSSLAGNFDYSTYSSVTLSYASQSSHTSAWTEGGNYAKLIVTVAPGYALNIAVAGTEGDSIDRGFLNSIQVVPVPEPSALAMLGLAGLPMLRRRRG